MFGILFFFFFLILLPILYIRDRREASTRAELQTPKGFDAYGYLSIFVSPYTVVRPPMQTQTLCQCHAKLGKSSLIKRNL